jgi:hypothetical protein
MLYPYVQIVISVGLVAYTFEYKNWREKKYMIRNIGLFLILIVSGGIGFYSIGQDKKEKFEKNWKDSITTAKIQTQYDSVYTELTKCRATVNNTNTTTYYQTYNLPAKTQFIKDGSDNTYHFDATNDAAYFIHIIDSVMNSYSDKAQKTRYSIYILYADRGDMETYAKEVKFYLRDYYKNKKYNYTMEFQTFEQPTGMLTLNGKYISVQNGGSFIMLDFMIREP